MTFSLIAKCPTTGQMGAVTATKFLSAGAFMILGEPEIGICVSQGFLNPLIRHKIMTDLRYKICIFDSLKSRLQEDSYPILRQVLVMDWSGQTAVHSGLGCMEIACELKEHGIVAAGNMLRSSNVINQMVEGFKSARGTLAERLVCALQQGHLAGGDMRGARSTALVVYDCEPYPVVDLRVDDSDDPIAEMLRLFEIYLNEYASVTRKLPTLKNPIGKLGPYPRARLRAMASQLKARGEAIPETWQFILNRSENSEE